MSEEVMHFQREEVTFDHEGDSFIYIFHRFESGNVSFRRKWNTTVPQEPEVIIYPPHHNAIANTAVIVLYKCATSGTHIDGLTGFLPDVLRTILDLYVSKEALAKHLHRAIDSFPVKKLKIASIDDVIKFLGPYAPWTVRELEV
jgi:hypothetical protein